MKLRVAIYAACMLITGTANTISTKFQDVSVVGQKEDGTAILFQHPAFQSACMFLGEALCLIPYFLLRWRRRRIKAAQGIVSKRSSPTSFYIKRTLAFAIPTLCDATGTTLLNVGLFYTYASTYQMLRGTLVLFTGFFTIVMLKRRLYLHHWLGMVLICAGAAIVGAASMLSPACPTPKPPASPSPAPDFSLDSASASVLDAETRQLLGLDTDPAGLPGAVSGATGGVLPGALALHWPGMFAAGWGQGRDAAGHGHGGEHVCGSKLPPAAAQALFGNAMVVLAQAFTAFQFILEEKWLGKFRIQPLLAVGIEGAWGVLLCAGALPLLNRVKTHEGLPVDDAVAAFRAMMDVPSLRYAVIGSVMSIGLFNFFGLSVTQALSGASRATIDACRTLLVWACSMAFGWEQFRQLQVVGFVVLLSGTSLYNELIRSCLPGLARMPSSLSSSDDEDEGGDALLEGDEEVDGEVDPLAVAAARAAQDMKGGWPAYEARNGYMDAQAGGLQEPLLQSSEAAALMEAGAAGVPRGPPPRDAAARVRAATPPRAAALPGAAQHSRSQRISGHSATHQGRSGHHHHHTTMARSMRLGFNALSPHDLADDEEESEVADEDVVDPMMLASTPYFGQSIPSLANLAAQGGSPSVGDLDGSPSEDRSPTADETASVPWAGLAAAVAAAATADPAAAGASGPSPAAAAGQLAGGAAAASPAAAHAARESGTRRGGGGFLAFMAGRQQEPQQQQQQQQPRR